MKKLLSDQVRPLEDEVSIDFELIDSLRRTLECMGYVEVDTVDVIRAYYTWADDMMINLDISSRHDENIAKDLIEDGYLVVVDYKG